MDIAKLIVAAVIILAILGSMVALVVTDHMDIAALWGFLVGTAGTIINVFVNYYKSSTGPPAGTVSAGTADADVN